MLALLLQSIGLGFSAGASPGPFQTYLITESAAQGWRAGLRISFVPLVSDAPIILLMLWILNQLPQQVLSVISLVGAGVLIWLAVGLVQRWRATQAGAGLPPASPNRSFWRGVLLNLTNPNPYIFWGTVGGPLLVQSWQQGLGWVGLLLFGFYGTFIATSCGLALFGSSLGRLPTQWLGYLWLTGAAVLTLLALNLILNVGLNLLA